MAFRDCLLPLSKFQYRTVREVAGAFSKRNARQASLVDMRGIAAR